ncbi:MAG: hypothetical protein MZW92_51075 [Comamonadaceae bacterium]|nr:hypothetical protein [Comamonadaceae bacterium]
MTVSIGLASLGADDAENCEEVPGPGRTAPQPGAFRMAATVSVSRCSATSCRHRKRWCWRRCPSQPADDQPVGEVVLELSDDSSQLSVSELEALVREETARHKGAASSPRS